MKNPVKTYSFWFKIIGAALLLTLGIWILFDKSIGSMLVLGFSGAVVFLYGIIRVIPLLRTLKNKKSKVVCLCEVVYDLLIGGFLFFCAIMIKKDADSDFSVFIEKYYRYFLGSVFYIRGLVYFACTILYNEETDRSKFYTHVILITLGAVIMAIENIKADTLATIIAILSLICSAAFIVEGGFGYNRYRNAIKATREPKKKEEAPVIEAPGEQDGNMEDKKPEEVIIDKDKNEDRPFVN